MRTRLLCLAVALASACGGPPAPPPPPTPTCTDATKNGGETGIDCGGPDCGKCADGKGCTKASDCVSNYCNANVCKSPTCTDGILNQDETGVDCGGSCPTCADGEPCNVGTDCTSTFCNSGACAALSCKDFIKNGNETDVDCGGTCPGCKDGLHCALAADCQSKVCASNICKAASCSDWVQNSKETDVDCGGGSCPLCAQGKKCSVGSDCVSASCDGGTCQGPTCTDTIKNGVETDKDCGGGTCPKCADGLACKSSSDCTSGICTGNKCVVATCSDTIKNGTETDLNCGGQFCPGCVPGKACLVGSDCNSSVCKTNVCQAPTCSDLAQNAVETDVDCGGDGGCAKCADGKACLVNADCQSLVCFLGFCSPVSCSDGIKNGREQAIDCGGDCSPCGPDTVCDAGTDCTSGVCTAGTCDETTCEALTARYFFDDPNGANIFDSLGLHNATIADAGYTRIVGKMDGGISFNNGRITVSAANATPHDIGESDFAVSFWAHLPKPVPPANSTQLPVGRLMGKGVGLRLSSSFMGQGSTGWAVVRWNGSLAQPTGWKTGTTGGTVPPGGLGLLISVQGQDTWLTGTCTSQEVDDKWHHYVFSFARQGGITVFVDGAPLSTPCGDLYNYSGSGTWFANTVGRLDQLVNIDLTSPCDFCIGQACTVDQACATGGEPFTGDLDDVALYGRALTVGEVSRLYNAGNPRPACRNVAGVGRLWVVDEVNKTLMSYPRLASGGHKPLTVVPGSTSVMVKPSGVTTTGSEVVVADRSTSALFHFKKTDDGAKSPSSSLSGALTSINGPAQLAAPSEIFVANYGGPVTVFGSSASGNASPARTVSGITMTQGLAVSSSNLFVSRHADSNDSARIAVYPRSWTAGSSPAQAWGLQGANTELDTPTGLAVYNGELFVVEAQLNKILVFGLTDSGDTAPRRVIQGPSTGIAQPVGISVAGGEIYVANGFLSGNIVVFGVKDFGDVSPRRVLGGLGSRMGTASALFAE